MTVAIEFALSAAAISARFSGRNFFQLPKSIPASRAIVQTERWLTTPSCLAIALAFGLIFSASTIRARCPPLIFYMGLSFIGFPNHAIANEKKIPFFAIGAVGTSLTGKDSTPFTVHYVHDTTTLGVGTATSILSEGGKTWFFFTSDYAFGTQLQDAAARVVTAGGGQVVGSVRAPIAPSDCASYLLRAQNSGAQVLGLAVAGSDLVNSLKAANDFLLLRTMKPAALLAFISDIHAVGLETAQGLYLI